MLCWREIVTDGFNQFLKEHLPDTNNGNSFGVENEIKFGFSDINNGEENVRTNIDLTNNNVTENYSNDQNGNEVVGNAILTDVDNRESEGGKTIEEIISRENFDSMFQPGAIWNANKTGSCNLEKLSSDSKSGFVSVNINENCQASIRYAFGDENSINHNGREYKIFDEDIAFQLVGDQDNVYIAKCNKFVQLFVMPYDLLKKPSNRKIYNQNLEKYLRLRMQENKSDSLESGDLVNISEEKTEIEEKLSDIDKVEDNHKKYEDIINKAISDGRIYSKFSENGKVILDRRSIEILNNIAKDMGYEIGKFIYNKEGNSVTAEINKLKELDDLKSKNSVGENPINNLIVKNEMEEDTKEELTSKEKLKNELNGKLDEVINLVKEMNDDTLLKNPSIGAKTKDQIRAKTNFDNKKANIALKEKELEGSLISLLPMLNTKEENNQLKEYVNTAINSLKTNNVSKKIVEDINHKLLNLFMRAEFQKMIYRNKDNVTEHIVDKIENNVEETNKIVENEKDDNIDSINVESNQLLDTNSIKVEDESITLSDNIDSNIELEKPAGFTELQIFGEKKKPVESDNEIGATGKVEKNEEPEKIEGTDPVVVEESTEEFNVDQIEETIVPQNELNEIDRAKENALEVSRNSSKFVNENNITFNKVVPEKKNSLFNIVARMLSNNANKVLDSRDANRLQKIAMNRNKSKKAAVHRNELKEAAVHRNELKEAA